MRGIFHVGKKGPLSAPLSPHKRIDWQREHLLPKASLWRGPEMINKELEVFIRTALSRGLKKITIFSYGLKAMKGCLNNKKKLKIMQFYGAVRRFTACLLYIFKREKIHTTLQRQFQGVYAAFVLFFFFTILVSLGRIPDFPSSHFSLLWWKLSAHFTLSFWDVWLREVFAFYSCLHSTHAGCQCVPRVWPGGNLHEPQLRAPVMQRHKKELWKIPPWYESALLPTDEPTRTHLVSSWEETFGCAKDWFHSAASNVNATPQLV